MVALSWPASQRLARPARGGYPPPARRLHGFPGSGTRGTQAWRIVLE